MNPQKSQHALVYDLIAIAEETHGWGQRADLQALLGEGVFIAAFERNLIKMGEIAKRLEPFGTLAQNPGLPWREIVGLRNIVVHQYDEVDDRRIRDVVENHLPPLIKGLKVLLENLPRPEGYVDGQ